MNIDWMCISLRKDREEENYADYFFSSAIYDKDPRMESRNIVVGHACGLFRIYKDNGNVELLRAMDGDEKNIRFMKAVSVIKKRWGKAEYPETDIYACG